MRKDVNTAYVYALLDGQEVVKYGKSREIYEREQSMNRKRNRGEIKFTEFKPIVGPMTEGEALQEETRLIKEFERKFGKKPKYNNSISVDEDEDE
jgi:hypothetical protein